MIGSIKGWIYGAALALWAAFSAWLYVSGRRDKKRDMELDDYENAEDIRRRVSDDRDGRVRKHDGDGWRD